VAKVSLHFGKSILDLDPDEVNAFLFHLAKEKKASSTYFKHTVYGLRFFFRLYGLEDRVLRLPTVKSDRKVPVALIYSAGLRVSEVCNLKISDIDSDRMQIRVVKSKGKYDRYVPLSQMLLNGLRKYLRSAMPSVYLFNGRTKGEPLGTGAVQQSFRLAIEKTGIIKDVSVHSLRHTYATHLLEQGVDIVTIKELLGHADIQTTMVYLHVAKVNRVNAHSPLDKLYSLGAKQ